MSYTTKASLILVALVAGVALVQAAGGIKGIQRAEDSQQRASGLKGPRPQQQQYLPPPPPPQPQPLPQQPLPQVQRPVAIKGPGQVAPNFNAARVRPSPVQQQVQQQPQQVQLQPQFQPIQQQPQQFQQVQVQQQQQEQEPEPEQQQQQQQQQEAEIDPNAAAQDNVASLIAPAAQAAPSAAAAATADSEEEANPRPEPYAFNYSFDSGDSATSGSSQREETQDASGKVTGFYTLKGEDGRDRRVDYVADASGFRATISTNEMGTADKDSADVDWQAQAASEAQLRAAESATQAARQRALQNPQPISSGSSLNRVSSPRQKVAAAAVASQQQIRESFSASKVQPQIAEPTISQLQEPFEQIRQTELNGRARKSRHAPFYLFTV